MNIVNGDLLKLAIDGQFDVIVHGCNCFCTMGAGIAKVIKIEFPEAYEADLATAKGEKSKLGSFSQVQIKRGNHFFTVINAYTQFDYRGKGIKTDYDAIRRVFKEIKTQFSGKLIGYPLIGAGLAGGDWKVISRIIDEALSGECHTLVEFAP